MDYAQSNEISSENSDEDDYTGYFMQPVNAYNIKTKIDTANKILFAEEHNDSIEKQSVVKFSVNLFEFEPDNSYYSEMEDESDGNSIIEEVDEDNIEEEEEISIVDENEEEIVAQQMLPKLKTNVLVEQKSIDIISTRVASLSIEEFSNEIETIEEDTVIEIEDSGENINENSSLLEEDDQQTSSISDDKLLNRPLKKTKKECKEIICDKYCKDFYNINRSTDNNGGYQPGLVLKLHRTCCEHSHHEKSLLPFYNGLHSEYGLSQKQIERKLKNTERKLKKEKELQARKEQEYYERSEQCERTFCNWLRSKFKKSDSKKRKQSKQSRPATENVKTARKLTKKSSIKNNIVIPLASSSDYEESSKKLKQFAKFKRKSSTKRTFHIHFIVS